MAGGGQLLGVARKLANVAYPGVAIGVFMKTVSIGRNVIVPKTGVIVQQVLDPKRDPS